MSTEQFRIRADLPHGFPQDDTIYNSVEAAEEKMRVSREAAPRQRPKEWREAFEALGNGWVERRTVSDWQPILKIKETP